jgi:hypothetical protein
MISIEISHSSYTGSLQAPSSDLAYKVIKHGPGHATKLEEACGADPIAT